MALIFGFLDESGEWYGEDPARGEGWSAPRVGWLTFRPGPEEPGHTSPFVGQRLEVRYASIGEEGDPGPVPYRLDDGSSYYPTMQVHEMLAGHRDPRAAPDGLDGDDLFRHEEYIADRYEPSTTIAGPADRDAYQYGAEPALARARRIYADLHDGDQHFDVSVEPSDPGCMRVEVLGAGGDGQRVAYLAGEFNGTDLAATLTRLGRLFFAAAAQASPRASRGPTAGRNRQGEPWTDEECELLAARYQAGTEVAALAAELGRSERAVRIRLYHLRLAPWPADSLPQRATPAPKPIPAYTMEDLRRSHPNSHKPWLPEDDARLATRFADGATVEELMVEFGRNHNAITSRLGHLRVLPSVADQQAAGTKPD